MPQWLKFVILALILFLVTSIPLAMQFENGSIEGFITDNHGSKRTGGRCFGGSQEYNERRSLTHNIGRYRLLQSVEALGGFVFGVGPSGRPRLGFGSNASPSSMDRPYGRTSRCAEGSQNAPPTMHRKANGANIAGAGDEALVVRWTLWRLPR